MRAESDTPFLGATCGAMRRLILACVAVVFGGDLGEEPPKLTARDVGFSGWGAVPEKKRVMLREKAGWKWDFPNEPPEYRARQEMRKSEILQLKHYKVVNSTHVPEPGPLAARHAG